MNNTKEITTANGTKAVLKSFLSYNDLEPTIKIEDVTAKSEKIIEIALLSINGVSDGAFAMLRTMPISDYKEVSKAVTDLVNGNFTPGK